MEMESETKPLTKPGSIRSKVFLFKPFGPVICKWSNPVLHKQRTILVVTLFGKVSFILLKLRQATTVNPFTPKILLVILLTDCDTILMMLVLKI